MTERFTAYDIFAVLIPGTVFAFLIALTLQQVADLQFLDWNGGFGDATVLIITGYAAGVFLQALGKAVSQSQLWRRHHGGLAAAGLLLPKSKLYSEEFKRDTLNRLQERYSALPSPQDPTYLHRLEELTSRAYKHVEQGDPQVNRHLAEQHQMRAHVIGFTLLTIATLASIPVGARSITFHLVLAAIYGALAVLARWRMKDKDIALARHVLSRFMEPSETRPG